MPPFAEDLSQFFRAADFATSAVYDSAGVNTTIQVIFDDPDLQQLGIGGTNPTAVCAASDVAADPTGKTLLLSSVTYTIRDIKPLDDGSTVQLELSAP